MATMSDECKQELNAMLAKLPAGVTNVRAEYAGSGDEGDFDDVVFTDAAGEVVRHVDDLAGEFEEFFGGLLEDDHPGWENNDGASGSFELDVATRKLTNEHTHYYTDSTTDSDEYEV